MLFQRQLTLLLLLLLAFFKRCAAKTVGGDELQFENGVKPLRQMEAIFHGLQKAVNFYSQNVEKVNLDSVFGLRVGQGGLSKAIAESKINPDNDLFKKLVKIHAEMVEIAERGFNKLKSSNSEYFHKFEHLIDGKWFAIMPYRTVDLSLVQKVTLEEDKSFNEGSSDQCMTNLIGSQETGAQMQCQVTDECWRLMTQKGAGGYYLTHQGLFFLLAENRGCRLEVLEKVGSDDKWLHHIRSIGANIYHQMSETYQQNKVEDDEIGRDLFFEQVIVCQMLGVLECFDTRFLDIILRLQDTSGCWKQTDQDESNGPKELVGNNDRKKKEGYADDATLEEQHPIVRFQGRKLREELVLQDGCSSHFTGVATGCLGMYAYWFASHPDTFGSAMEELIGKPWNVYSSFKMINPNGDTVVFSTMKWVIIFLIVAISFYFFRKWRRNLPFVLRKYRKFSI